MSLDRVFNLRVVAANISHIYKEKFYLAGHAYYIAINRKDMLDCQSLIVRDRKTEISHKKMGTRSEKNVADLISFIIVI